MAQRIHHLRGRLSIDTSVAELPKGAVIKRVQGALLSHNEAVQNASRRAACPDARQRCQRFHAPWQQLMLVGGRMAVLSYVVFAPAEDHALLRHGQAVGKSCVN